jgi:hypothetical protein
LSKGSNFKIFVGKNIAVDIIISKAAIILSPSKTMRAPGRDAGTIKRQGGKRTPKGTSIDPGEDINLQLCVDLPMKANALNQVTFKITLSGSIFITQRALLPPLPLPAKGKRGSCPTCPPPPVPASLAPG